MPLDTMRRKLKSQAKEIAELQQRMEKVEVAVGKAGSGELPPNEEREEMPANEQPSEGES